MKKVVSRAHRSPNGFVDHLTTSYDFGDGKVVTADASFAAAMCRMMRSRSASASSETRTS